jgi:hypothetical protein
VKLRLFISLVISNRHCSLTWLGIPFSRFFVCAISVTASCLGLVSSPADRAPRGFVPGHKDPFLISSHFLFADLFVFAHAWCSPALMRRQILLFPARSFVQPSFPFRGDQITCSTVDSQPKATNLRLG